MPTAMNEWCFFSIAWYYGDDDFIIRTIDFIACSDECSARDLYLYAMIQLFLNCAQLQGFPNDSHIFS